MHAVIRLTNDWSNQHRAMCVQWADSTLRQLESWDLLWQLSKGFDKPAISLISQVLQEEAITGNYWHLIAPGSSRHQRCSPACYGGQRGNSLWALHKPWSIRKEPGFASCNFLTFLVPLSSLYQRSSTSSCGDWRGNNLHGLYANRGNLTFCNLLTFHCFSPHISGCLGLTLALAPALIQEFVMHTAFSLHTVQIGSKLLRTTMDMHHSQIKVKEASADSILVFPNRFSRVHTPVKYWLPISESHPSLEKDTGAG